MYDLLLTRNKFQFDSFFGLALLFFLFCGIPTKIIIDEKLLIAALFVVRVPRVHRGELARSRGDLVVQPTYLHKHDAPLCFPFSLRAPYRTFSKRRRTRRRTRKRRQKNLTLLITQPNFVTTPRRVFYARRRGRRSRLGSKQRGPRTLIY